MAASYTVEISGALLSSLLFEHASSVEAQDGILLGGTSLRVTNTLSDSQISNEKHETVYNVQNFIPFPHPFSFYNNGGLIRNESLDMLARLSQGENGEVIGWYRFRRNSSPEVSLRERTVFQNFHKMSPKSIFALFTESSALSGSTHIAEHVFYRHDGRCMEPIPLRIGNLKDSDHSQYRAFPLQTSLLGSFAKVLNDVDSTTSEESAVEKANTINRILHEKITDACSRLTKSAKVLDELQTEVKNLEALAAQRLGRRLELSSDGLDKQILVYRGNSSCD